MDREYSDATEGPPIKDWSPWVEWARRADLAEEAEHVAMNEACRDLPDGVYTYTFQLFWPERMVPYVTPSEYEKGKPLQWAGHYAKSVAFWNGVFANQD